ncbi:MAG: lauroyl acyltransferase [Pseudomonadota bacterium]|nr:lauroyl acyltransferase [Pseudomonadota bacterium]
MLLSLVLGIFGALPIDIASRLGGRLGRAIGPRLGLTRVARRNIQRALPQLRPAGVQAVIAGMWENLGRNAAEYPHLGRFYDGGRVEIVGAENVIRLRDDGIGGIFFSAHYGNWELLSLVLDHLGMAPVMVYRAANNPYSERLIQDIRTKAHHKMGAEYIAKSGEGLRAMVKALRAGKHLAMLVDQKMNRGMPVPFFGRDAMTAPALAQMALKYRVPVVPAKMERLHGAHFRITLYPPLALADTGDADADVAAAMGRINALFEDWIRERPDHWLWIHRRWSDDG